MPTPAIRDSVGVRIVEYASIEAAPTIRLARQATLDIGGVRPNPTEELDPRSPYLDPVRLADGRIVVSDMFRLVFYDSLGRLLGTAGRRGDGPAEFRQIARVCRLAGDTLLAISENDRRVLLWDAHGRHVRTYARPGPILMDSCFPDGTLVAPILMASASDDSSRIAEGGSTSDSVAYQRIAPDGSVRRMLGVYPRSQLDAEVTYYVQVWYGHNHLYVADARRYEVQTYDTTGGRLQSIVRVTAPLARPRSRERRARLSSGRAIVTTARGTARPPLETESAFGQIIVDERGWLWIPKYRERAWRTVFDASGVLVGTVYVPKASANDSPMIVAIDGDHVVVRCLDDDGAVHLRWYRFYVTR